MYHKFVFTIVAFCCCFISYTVNAGAYEEICDGLKQSAVSKPPTWGADYIDGIDVHGNKVVTADLAPAKQVFDPIVVPIKLDVAKKFGITLPDFMTMESDVYHVFIDGHGRVHFNDKDVTERVRIVCSEYNQENYEQTPQDHGHEQVNAVPSDDIIHGQYPPNNE